MSLALFCLIITGSRNKPAWPIAPGIANANQPRQITLISGEDEAEWEKNRLQVAEAAGLKHIEQTVGEQADIYGQGGKTLSIISSDKIFNKVKSKPCLWSEYCIKKLIQSQI